MNDIFNFSEVTAKDCPLLKLSKEIVDKELKVTSLDRPIVKEINVEKKISRCPIEGSGGHWEGERGNSNWFPDRAIEPGDRHGTNLQHKTWGQILDSYGIHCIPFKDGEPNFSEVSKGDVTIDDFTDERDSNFNQADEKLAEQRGCSPEEVAKWRKENSYTWHECKDCKTMKKIPREVHGNIPHSGGISQVKVANRLVN